MKNWLIASGLALTLAASGTAYADHCAHRAANHRAPDGAGDGAVACAVLGVGGSARRKGQGET